MVHLVIRVDGKDKWVTVEDLSGPVIKFNGLVKPQPGNDVVVDIHSTPSRPGRALVYAGWRENDRSAKFLCEKLDKKLKQPCVLTIKDEDLRPRGQDGSGFIECQCKRIEPPEKKEDEKPTREGQPEETTAKQ